MFRASDPGSGELPTPWNNLAMDEATSRSRVAANFIALDRGSVRTVDKDGRLHLSVTNISKANVCPYVGKEIPECESLGLDPKKVYKLLRDPGELAKAAASFNNQPVLSEHVPVLAPDYDEKVKKFVIGSTGTDAAFEPPYLKNSLVVWSGKAIEAIESDEQKEISSGYHYRADMTPGVYEGEPYDGVMRDIVGNHVAIVEEGRAGPDVVVGDSKENLMSKSTRFAARALQLTAHALGPVLAKDAKIDILPLFRGLTRENFKTEKPKILAFVKTVPLAKDASIKHVTDMLDALEEMGGAGGDEPVSEPQEKAMQAAAAGKSTLGIPEKVGKEFVEKDEEPEPEQPTVDEGPMREYLKGKGMDDASIEEAVKLMHPAGATDTEQVPSEEEEEARAKDKAARDKAAKDKAARDRRARGGRDEPPPFEGMPKTKAAMDAMKKEIAADARQEAVKQMRAVRAAEVKVEPHVGKIAIACDTAADVFKTALGILGVPDDKLKTIPAAGFEPMFDLLPKPGRGAPREEIAQDAKSVDDFNKRFPGAAHIRLA
jgi:hypothetical protein